MAGEAAENAAAATNTPSNEAFANLADYMYSAHNTTYSSTGLQGDIGFKPLEINGKIVKSVINKDGLYAEAFISVDVNGNSSSSSQVVVAYEGTNLYNQSNKFTGGQLRDDTAIAAGTNAPSYQPAADFANRVIGAVTSLGIQKSNVFVTGHSLGAAEAEYAARSTGLGGVTFAAPGIKGPAQAAANLTDYVDAGDPIGNYANNDVESLDNAWGQNVTLSKNINHYGTVVNELNDSNGEAAFALDIAGTSFGQQTTAAGKEEYVFGGLLTTLQSDDIYIEPSGTKPNSGTQPTISGLGDFHHLSQYANDLGVTLFIPEAVCYASGTCIRVIREGGAQDILVECLAVGDLAVTASGMLRPIRWLGHRVLRCATHREPTLVNPVRISAHAFGPGRPARDLLVSPGHSICIDVGGEILIPTIALVNGTTIQQVEVDEVTYWHVELESHDILLAENLPAESYLEMGNRIFFAEAETAALHARPDAPVATHADFCRPYVDSGPLLEAVRAMLRKHAGAATHEVAAAA